MYITYFFRNFEKNVNIVVFCILVSETHTSERSENHCSFTVYIVNVLFIMSIHKIRGNDGYHCSRLKSRYCPILRRGPAFCECRFLRGTLGVADPKTLLNLHYLLYVSGTLYPAYNRYVPS